MNVGLVFTLLGGFLTLAGGLFALLIGRPGGPGGGFTTLVGFLLGVAVAALGVALVVVGRRRDTYEREQADRNLAEQVLALARKGGGRVSLDEVSRTAGLPSAEAQAKMRALVGKGMFDLDFDANGQMVYKLAGPGAQPALAPGPRP